MRDIHLGNQFLNKRTALLAKLLSANPRRASRKLLKAGRNLGGTPRSLSLSCAGRHRMRGLLAPHWEDTAIRMPPSRRIVPARHHGTEFSMDSALSAWDQHPYFFAFCTLLLAKTIPATPTPKIARLDGSGTLATVTSSNGVGSLRNTS